MLLWCLNELPNHKKNQRNGTKTWWHEIDLFRGHYITNQKMHYYEGNPWKLPHVCVYKKILYIYIIFLPCSIPQNGSHLMTTAFTQCFLWGFYWKPRQPIIIAPTPLAFQISANSIQPEFSQSLLSALQTAALAGNFAAEKRHMLGPHLWKAGIEKIIKKGDLGDLGAYWGLAHLYSFSPSFHKTFHLHHPLLHHLSCSTPFRLILYTDHKLFRF